MRGIRWITTTTTALLCLTWALWVLRRTNASDTGHHQEQWRDIIILADLGVLFRTHSTVHASISVNLTYLVDHCQALQDQHALTPSTNNRFRVVQQLLDQVCRDINDLGMEVDIKRQKRQILAAIALGFTSIFGMYGATQIHRIDQQIQGLSVAQTQT